MRYMSVFSGVGGFEQGLDKLGWECVGQCEVDKYASMILKFNFGEVTNYGDITQLDTAGLPQFDCLVGGSPCQNLSIAGNRKGLEGLASRLFHDYVRILRDCQPAYFLYENVKGALSCTSGWDFAIMLSELEEAGYDLQWAVLNAKDFGVAQSRERLYIVGHLRGSACPEISAFAQGNQLHSPQGNRGPEEGHGVRGEVCPTASTITKNYHRGVHCGGETYVLQELTRGLAEAYRVYSDKIARTLTALGGGIGAKTDLYAIPNATSQPVLSDGGETYYQTKDGSWMPCVVRRLTPMECERLMGWEDNWTAKGMTPDGKTVDMSDSRRYMACGNGVASPVITAIAKSLPIRNDFCH